MLFKFLMKRNTKIDLSISIIIIINYLYFYLFSYQKYLRYSQIFLVLTVYYLLYLLSNEERLSIFEKFTFLLLLSFYLSSELLIFFLLIYSILSYKKKSIFILLFTFLLLNIINLQYESRSYVSSNLKIYEYRNNISSVGCIANYLPYDYKIKEQ